MDEESRVKLSIFLELWFAARLGMTRIAACKSFKPTSTNSGQDPNGIHTGNCVRWTKNTKAYALPTARRLEHPHYQKEHYHGQVRDLQ